MAWLREKKTSTTWIFALFSLLISEILDKSLHLCKMLYNIIYDYASIIYWFKAFLAWLTTTICEIGIIPFSCSESCLHFNRSSTFQIIWKLMKNKVTLLVTVTVLESSPKTPLQLISPKIGNQCWSGPTKILT